MADDAKVKAVLCCRVPVQIKLGIEQFRTSHKIKTETEAIVQLVQIGLFVDSIKGQLQDPAIVTFLQENLYNQALVDWIFGLPSNRLEALYSAFASARELRHRS
jgi:hypothetical protein